MMLIILSNYKTGNQSSTIQMNYPGKFKIELPLFLLLYFITIGKFLLKEED